MSENIESILENLTSDDYDSASIATTTDDSFDSSNVIEEIQFNTTATPHEDNYPKELDVIVNSLMKLGRVSENVLVENSTNVNHNNITIVKGPIYVTQINLGTSEPCSTTKISNNSQADEITNDESELNQLNLVSRRMWLAQRPLNPYEYIEDPVQFVIISHTKTESSAVQSENKYIIRYIQCFHIESERWNDIGYNFLIGDDGFIYEGRGWGVIGKHTKEFDHKSLGIAFVGTFSEQLPTEESLKSLKKLIKNGVQLGYILPNYALMGQCQVFQTESPGKFLFDELKGWEQFKELNS